MPKDTVGIRYGGEWAQYGFYYVNRTELIKSRKQFYQKSAKPLLKKRCSPMEKSRIEFSFFDFSVGFWSKFM